MAGGPDLGVKYHLHKLFYDLLTTQSVPVPGWNGSGAASVVVHDAPRGGN
jgi:hypothetical protein